MSIAAKALVELTDGCKGPEEIMEQTGLPMDRCDHIYNVILLARLEALPDELPVLEDRPK